MLATDPRGELVPLTKAQIQIPYGRGSTTGPIAVYTISLRVLPEISDTKSSDYPDENIIGRSFPVKVYSHSGNRSIGWKCTFVTLTENDKRTNLQNLRALQSAVYPDVGRNVPYIPPPICRIRCGKVLTAEQDGWLCVVLKQYTFNTPTDVVWDDETYLPYKFEVDLQWDVVFNNSTLPGQDRILKDF